MADNSGFLKIGLFAGAGFLAWQQGWFSKLGIGSQAASPAAGTLPSQPAAGAAVKAPPGPSLSDLYAKLVTAVGAATAATADANGVVTRPGPDEFNAILTQIYPAAGPLPDPGPMFPGWTRGQAMPIATYWAATSAWLTANRGLSGLNAYSGLAGLAQRRGW